MKHVLQRPVLALNRFRQAIEETNVATALGDMCRGAKRGIDTSTMLALSWDEWIKLPIRENDEHLMTVRGPVRVPTVIITHYDGMPLKTLKNNRRGIGLRDKFICGYTGTYCPDGTVDHIKSKARGGGDNWENKTWSRRDINQKKADKSVEEAGLKLLRRPRKPLPLPAAVLIEPKHADWRYFLYDKETVKVE